MIADMERAVEAARAALPLLKEIAAALSRAGHALRQQMRDREAADLMPWWQMADYRAAGQEADLADLERILAALKAKESGA